MHVHYYCILYHNNCAKLLIKCTSTLFNHLLLFNSLHWRPLSLSLSGSSQCMLFEKQFWIGPKLWLSFWTNLKASIVFRKGMISLSFQTFSRNEILAKKHNKLWLSLNFQHVREEYCTSESPYNTT